MLKRQAFFWISGALLTVSLAAQAKPYGAAGCGLGSVLIGPSPGYGQIFAATTNGSSYSQLFGITSGTSNCIPGSHMEAFNAQKQFVDGNLANLATEMAQGTGSTLFAFAETLGCDTNSELAKALQSSHGKIFRETDSEGILLETYDVIKADTNLAQNCKKVL